MPETKNIKKTRAPRTASAEKSAKSRHLFKRRWVRISLALLLVVIIIAGAILSVIFASDALFFKNEHFTLRRITVQSPGWWNRRSQRVSSVLDLTLNDDNLFAIDLEQKRMVLEANPSIGQVSISRVLPDTLVIKITEKIPRAALYSRRSKWLINDSAMVMDRDTCLGIGNDLPVIYGLQLSKKLTAGVILKKTLPALELIALVLQHYPGIKLFTINISDPKFMDIKLLYGSSNKIYSVRMPKEQLPVMTKILKNSLRQARLTGDTRQILNLTYRGKAIFSGRR